MTSVVLLSVLTVACGGSGAPRDTTSSTKPAAPAMDPAPAADSSPASALDHRRTILVLGTSLTAGLGLEPDSAYPQQIQRKIDARRLRFEVVIAWVSGVTSAGLLRRL